MSLVPVSWLIRQACNNPQQSMQLTGTQVALQAWICIVPDHRVEVWTYSSTSVSSCFCRHHKMQADVFCAVMTQLLFRLSLDALEGVT